MIARLPAKRKRPKMGVQKPPQREWPRHRRFVKSRGCSIPGCVPIPGTLTAIIDFHHVRTRGAGGHDCFGVSVCRHHHIILGTISVDEARKRFGVDLWALAREFTRRSPDTAMKASLALVEIEA